MNNIKVILAALAIALLVVQPVRAGFNEGSSVTMGGSPVFQIPAGAEGFSAQHRAWLAQDALDNALVLSNDKSPAAVSVARVNGAETVLLDGRVVATADAESARLEGLSVSELANKWADSIRNFLSDSARVDKYLSALTGKNPVEANVAVVERKMYAPQGFAFQVRLAKNVSIANAQTGEKVEGILEEDVPMGSYVLPAKSVVIGEVIQTENSDYNIEFDTLRTPAGTEVPIKAVATADVVIKTEGPHNVCTYAIPSGSVIGYPDVAGRIPASIGIGIPSRERTIVLRKDGNVIAAGQPVTVILEDTTPIAVVRPATAM